MAAIASTFTSRWDTEAGIYWVQESVTNALYTLLHDDTRKAGQGEIDNVLTMAVTAGRGTFAAWRPFQERRPGQVW